MTDKAPLPHYTADNPPPRYRATPPLFPNLKKDTLTLLQVIYGGATLATALAAIAAPATGFIAGLLMAGPVGAVLGILAGNAAGVVMAAPGAATMGKHHLIRNTITAAKNLFSKDKKPLNWSAGHPLAVKAAAYAAEVPAALAKKYVQPIKNALSSVKNKLASIIKSRKKHQEQAADETASSPAPAAEASTSTLADASVKSSFDAAATPTTTNAESTPTAAPKAAPKAPTP